MNRVPVMPVAVIFIFAIWAADTLNAQDADDKREAGRTLLETALQTNAQLADANQKLAVQIAALSVRLKALQEEVVKLRADRDEKLQRVVLLTDELHKMQELTRRLEERQKELVAQIARLDAEPTDDAPVADYAVVLAVKDRFVEISVGSDDGIKAGHHLDAFRGREFVARVVVRKTWPDKSVAEVIPELKKKEIQKGDRLATHRKSNEP